MKLTETNIRPDVSAVRQLRIVDLGTIEYSACWGLQNKTAAAVAAGETETLFLLEHPHTYTCGRAGGRDHILIPEEELRASGVAVLNVDRGGDVTYHGPGQLVAYPVIAIANNGLTDYPRYVRRLEDVIIGCLADFGISGSKLRGFSGVWVEGSTGPEKIAAIGVRVDGRGITTHGIALNLTTDLNYFSKIVPCGISDKGVTSMSRLLPSPPGMTAVKDSFVRNFCSVFEFVPLLMTSASVVRQGD